MVDHFPYACREVLPDRRHRAAYHDHPRVEQVEIGFTQVGPYNFVAQTEELAAALIAAGVTAPTGHARLLSGDQDEIFAAAQRLGMGIVIDPNLPEEHWQNAEAVRGSAARLNTAAKKAAEYGIRVGYRDSFAVLRPSGRG